MAKHLLRCAVLYALFGIGMGVVMGASGDFTNKGVHVHLNLVGWVSMALMAMAYQVFPAMARSVLAKVQFWLHNLGLPVMAWGIYALMHRLPLGEQLTGAGSMVVALAFLSFAVNVWLHAGQQAVVAEGVSRQPANLAAA